MTTPRIKRGSSRIAVAMALLAIWSCGCREREAPAPRVVRVDLVKRVESGSVDLRQTPTVLDFRDVKDMSFLPAGWYSPLMPPAEPNSPVWTNGPAAVVELPLANTRPLHVAITIAALVDLPQSPKQYLTLLWNDKPLKTVEAEGPQQKIELSIPTDKQRHGVNTLAVLPRFWGPGRVNATDEDQRRRAIAIRSITTNRASRSPAPEFPAAAVDEGTIVQHPGTSIAFNEILPAGAHLRGRAALGAMDAGVALKDGASVVTITSDTRPEKIVFWKNFKELQAMGAVEFDIDLSAYAGEAVALNFLASAADTGSGTPVPDLKARWVEPRIEGEAPPLASAVLAKRDRRPNVLVVLFDTLRADFTSISRAGAVKTPALAKLADSGIAFTNTTSNAPSTRPSCASLMTGLYPPSHNVTILDVGLATDLPYLPEILRKNGYSTTALSNNPHISKDLGFERGYDQFTEFFREDPKAIRRDHGDPRERARFMWESYVQPSLDRRGDHPFFVYLHELDPHFPYDPLPPYDKMYDFGYRGALATDHEAESTDETAFFQTLFLLDVINKNPSSIADADMQLLRSRYAGEVSYMDAYLEWILNRLEQSGLRDDTLVVFVSDHGEQFYEHGYWTHGHTVHQEEIAVPLVFAQPGRLPDHRRSSVHAELVDVAPTILDAVGLEIPSGMQGRSLVPFMSGEASDAADEYAFAYGDPMFPPAAGGAEQNRRQDSVVVDRWKLIRLTHEIDKVLVRGYELYDRQADPGERVNLWAVRPILGNALRTILEREDMEAGRSAGHALGEKALDGEMKDRLRSLGYAQ